MTKRVKMLSAEEERALLDAYHDHGDIEARNKLMLAYQPLATAAAEKFAKKGSASLSDLVQEATLGLAGAIENFKRDKNSRLSTLAPYYVKQSLIRYVMDFNGVVRVGTNFPDKKVFMNLRRKAAEIEARTGKPLTDEDREAIAADLKVKPEIVKRMEPRVFQADVSVPMTDSAPDEETDGRFSAPGIVPVKGEQHIVEREIDQARIMGRIVRIVMENYSDRDLEIVTERLKGDMTPARYKALVDKHGITVERIRQIQRGALAVIREALYKEGITGMDMIAA